MEPKHIVNRKLAFNPNDENNQSHYNVYSKLIQNKLKGIFNFYFILLMYESILTLNIANKILLLFKTPSKLSSPQ